MRNAAADDFQTPSLDRSGDPILPPEVTLEARLNHARIFGALDLLERLGVGAILLAPDGKVIRATSHIDRIFCPEFRIRGHRIAIRDRSASDHLASVVRSISDLRSGLRSAGPLPAPREFGHPLALHLVSLEEQNVDSSSAAAIILIVTDPDARPRLAPESVIKMFGLTPAEANLASRLSTGQSLGQAAEDLGTACGTVRTQLKAIFAKTGTSKQGALVALLGGLNQLAP